MGRTKLLSFIIIASASIFALILFLFFDYFFGKNFSIKVTLPIQLTFEEKPYVKLEGGWYELKRNFYGSDQFGNSIIPVRTDAFGFRQALSKSENLKSKVIFLGDSFTYGINLPFEKTFAGIFTEQTKIKILNAGVASYSPTPYLYQYKKALKENALTDNHIVIIALDISDVQDEAHYWEWNNEVDPHPKRIGLPPTNDPFNTNVQNKNLRIQLREAFPLTTLIYRYVKHYEKNISESPNPDFQSMVNSPRSAFTWQDWRSLDSSYSPLGVKGGLHKISSQISNIIKLAQKNNGSVFVLIYPWPAQLVYSDQFNWSAWVHEECKNKCKAVIDTIKVFRKLKEDNSQWYTDYFLIEDFHFNELGNKIIATELIKNIPTSLYK